MQRRPLKVISLNVQLNQWRERAASFLKKEQADAVCLQEVLASDMPFWNEACGVEGRFEPMAISETSFTKPFNLKKGDPFGVAVFSRLPAVFSAAYYCGASGTVPTVKKSPLESSNRMVLSATVSIEGATYTIGTTHFTWTPEGEADDRQRRDVVALLRALERFPDLILCGDFNAPRGWEIWNLIAEKYHDNIPARYDSSLDPNLHRVKGLKRMVDGFWSTPEYQVSNVSLVSGVSDHQAVIGLVERR